MKTVNKLYPSSKKTSRYYSKEHQEIDYKVVELERLVRKELDEGFVKASDCPSYSKLKQAEKELCDVIDEYNSTNGTLLDEIMRVTSTTYNVKEELSKLSTNETFFTNCSKCGCLTTPENGVIKNNIVTCNECKVETLEEVAYKYTKKISEEDNSELQNKYKEIEKAFIAGYKQCEKDFKLNDKKALYSEEEVYQLLLLKDKENWHDEHNEPFNEYNEINSKEWFQNNKK